MYAALKVPMLGSHWTSGKSQEAGQCFSVRNYTVLSAKTGSSTSTTNNELGICFTQGKVIWKTRNMIQ